MNQIIYVGNYSNGIKKLEFNHSNFLDNHQTIGNFKNCSYICKYKNYLYSVVEINGNETTDSGYIVSYEINKNSEQFINQCPSFGKGPCFLVVDSIRKILYVTNYTEGSFVALKIEKDGSIGKLLYNKKFSNISHIHHIQFSQDFKNFYVIDLGTDYIIEYSILYDEQNLTLKETSKFKFPCNSEPRHLSIDSKNNIYVITEKSCELYKLKHNSKNKLILLNKTSILPPETHIQPNYTGCAIKINSTNQFLYTSIRGHNSISVFNIENNNLNLIQNIKCEGNCPRDISFDLYEKYLLCANQISNNISIFNLQNGLLKYQNNYIIEAPSCILSTKKNT